MSKRFYPPFLTAFIALWILHPITPVCALDVPLLKGYVNDYADMISPLIEAQLDQELRAFENTDSTQIVILTIPSLEGEIIEQFSIKVAESWKIGQKGRDNGAIFIAVKQDRKMRIEVGRGLEGKLTDLMAGRVIDLVVKPRFKRGDFDGGFVSGIHALIDATRGEFRAEPDHQKQTGRGSPPSFLTFLIFGGMLLVFLGSISRFLSGAAGAVGLPVFAYISKLALSPVALLLAAFFGLMIGFIIPSLFSVGRYSRGGGLLPGGGYHGGGWGGSSGSSDFGGGGFSGGGGSFGGGGASGDW